MLDTNWLGALAGALTTVAFLPQVIKTWRSRSAQDISGLTFALFGLGVALWLVYGLQLRLWPVILANAITLLLALTILWCKLRYRAPSSRD
jgi:MtN3 and saliva related transmembrane protein